MLEGSVISVVRGRRSRSIPIAIILTRRGQGPNQPRERKIKTTVSGLADLGLIKVFA
jgi:hypothetical protein